MRQTDTVQVYDEEPCSQYTVELHTVQMEESMMKMRRIDAIIVPPVTPTLLKPGGSHIMLLGLKQPLVAGQTFSPTLAL